MLRSWITNNRCLWPVVVLSCFRPCERVLVTRTPVGSGGRPNGRCCALSATSTATYLS